MRAMTIVNLILGIVLIATGVWLIWSFILAFVKIFLGIILILIGLGFLFTRTMHTVRYRVR